MPRLLLLLLQWLTALLPLHHSISGCEGHRTSYSTHKSSCHTPREIPHRQQPCVTWTHSKGNPTPPAALCDIDTLHGKSHTTSSPVWHGHTPREIPHHQQPCVTWSHSKGNPTPPAALCDMVTLQGKSHTTSSPVWHGHTPREIPHCQQPCVTDLHGHTPREIPHHHQPCGTWTHSKGNPTPPAALCDWPTWTHSKGNPTPPPALCDMVTLQGKSHTASSPVWLTYMDTLQGKSHTTSSPVWHGHTPREIPHHQQPCVTWSHSKGNPTLPTALCDPPAWSHSNTPLSSRPLCIAHSWFISAYYTKIEYLRLSGLAQLQFVGCLTSQQHVSVSQGPICSDKCAATLRQKLQIKRFISPSHSTLTPGQPVPALTL